MTASREISLMLERVVTDLDLSAIEATPLRQSLLNGEFVEQFVVGPSFSDAHRQFMARQLSGSPSTLGHAFTASAMSWGDDSDVTSPEPGSSRVHSKYFEKMYGHATKAVATLRSLRPSNALEMCRCVVLGSTILTFTLKLRVADARAICRQTLEMVKPIYTTETLFEEISPEHLSIMSCLLVTDIAESLIFCNPPTLRCRNLHGQDYIDPFVGISHSLLPLLHDVALLSFQFKLESSKVGCHPAAPAQVEQDRRTLGLQIRQWVPDGRIGFVGSTFSSAEVSHMICQAEVLRNAARLVLHRLRYRFGSQDEVAEAISSHILTSLKTTALVTGSIPRCVDFALMVACFELESDSERADCLSSLSPISTYSSRFHERTKVIFDAAWAARKNGQSFYWYDLAAFIPESSNCA